LFGPDHAEDTLKVVAAPSKAAVDVISHGTEIHGYACSLSGPTRFITWYTAPGNWARKGRDMKLIIQLSPLTLSYLDCVT
jgi:hypothetical protein